MKRSIPAVFDDLEIGITLHDPETGAILAVNERFEELSGYTEAQLREMAVSDYSADGGGFTEAKAARRIRAAAEGDPQTFEWHVEQASGDLVWVRVRLAATTLDGDQYVIAEIRDITERKERERELEAERSFIQQSLDALDDAFYVLDTDGSLGRWNNTVSEVTGYTDEEIAEMTAMDFFTGEDVDRTAEAIEEVLQTGSAVVEADYVTQNGEPVPYEFTGARLTDADGNLEGIIGIGRDITKRKANLKRLRRQEQVLRRVHQAISSSAPFEEKLADLLQIGREYMGVEQGFFTRFSDDIQEIVVGVGPNSQLQDGVTAPYAESYCRHTVDNREEAPLTVEHASEDGWEGDPAFERFGLACYAGSTIELDGEVYGTLCFADRDPHDREFSEFQETFLELLSTWVSAELERENRERKYRRLTDRISSAYYAVDTDWNVTFWNDAIAQRQGISAEAVLGASIWEQFPEIQGTTVEERLREAMASEEPTTCEYHHESLDYWAKLQIFPDEDGLAVISTDITERKEYEARLEQSNERLQQFAYVLSHDLQEPLRMVSSYIDLLEVELEGQLDEEAREYMAFAVDGADRMQEMIDGLLQYSRVETRGDEFTETDLAEVLADVREDLQLSLEETNVDVTAEDLPTVHADSQQMRQLFQNLLKNAIDHAGDGTNVTITAEQTTDGHRIAVSDDGPGIPDDQQETIFGLFDKGGASEGTGIGLAVCERIVDRHDGRLRVESTPGERTTFSFTLHR